jgi:membrane-bound ClpP family serine protease
VSLSAADALRLHVIDVIADDVPGRLREIDVRTVKVAGKPEQLVTAGGRQRRSNPIHSRKDNWLIQPAPTEYSQSRPPAHSYPSAPDR